METGKRIALINVPSQLGAGRSAVGHGWFARVDSIRCHLESVGLTVAELYTIQEPCEPLMGDARCRYRDGVLNVAKRVMDRVTACLEQGLFPVTLGGDHSVAIGSVSGVSRYLRQHDQRLLGLMWVDAHIDMNTTETTPSGNIHGMALATLLGLGSEVLSGLPDTVPAVDPRYVAVVGFRFADKSEIPNLSRSGPEVFSMRDLDRDSIVGVMERALPRVAVNTGGVHLSLDLDSLDPSVAPAVNTPFPGGMTFREVRALCENLAATGQLKSLDIVEHNPEKGYDEVMLPLISELIACALGSPAMPDTLP